jgi:hypothetical protein
MGRILDMAGSIAHEMVAVARVLGGRVGRRLLTSAGGVRGASLLYRGSNLHQAPGAAHRATPLGSTTHHRSA